MTYNKNHHPLFILIITLLFFLCSLNSYANASFAVAPERVNINLNNPTTQTFLIRNTGTELIHLRVTPEFYPLSSKAISNGKSLNPTQELKTSLKSFMIISPEALSLRPGEQRDVRVSVHVPANAKQGTYRAHVLVKMLEVARTYGINKLNKHGERIGISLNMMMEMAVAVYGNLGHGTPKLITQCSKVDDKLMVHVSNPTPWIFLGPVTVKYRNSKRITESAAIFPDSLLNLVFKWDPKTRKKLSIVWHNKQTNSEQISHCTIA